MSDLELPVVHLNGTSAESLSEQFRAAKTALEYALEACSKAAPHGRDYYPSGSGSYTRATKQYIARQQKLVDVLQEVTEIYEHVIEKGSL